MGDKHANKKGTIELDKKDMDEQHDITEQSTIKHDMMFINITHHKIIQR
jgi:hypothetical protein